MLSQQRFKASTPGDGLLRRQAVLGDSIVPRGVKCDHLFHYDGIPRRDTDAQYLADPA